MYTQDLRAFFFALAEAAEAEILFVDAEEGTIPLLLLYVESAEFCLDGIIRGNLGNRGLRRALGT